jgi:hypothetical protein
MPTSGDISVKPRHDGLSKSERDKNCESISTRVQLPPRILGVFSGVVPTVVFKAGGEG